MVWREMFFVFAFGQRFEDFDKLGKRFIVVHRLLGQLIVVEDGFRLFVFFPLDIVCDMVVAVM